MTTTQLIALAAALWALIAGTGALGIGAVIRWADTREAQR